MDDFEVEIKRNTAIIERNHQNVLSEEKYTRIIDALDCIDSCIERAEQAKPSEPVKNQFGFKKEEQAVSANEIRDFADMIQEVYSSINKNNRVLSDNEVERVDTSLNCMQKRIAQYEERLEQIEDDFTFTGSPR